MCVRANIEPLAWESEYFQLRSAKLAFSSTAPQLTTADLQPFDIVQAKIPANQLVLADDLANLGFRLVEEIDLSLSTGLEQIGTRNANSAGTTIFGSRIAVPEDILGSEHRLRRLLRLAVFEPLGINLATALVFMPSGWKKRS